MPNIKTKEVGGWNENTLDAKMEELTSRGGLLYSIYK